MYHRYDHQTVKLMQAERIAEAHGASMARAARRAERRQRARAREARLGLPVGVRPSWTFRLTRRLIQRPTTA